MPERMSILDYLSGAGREYPPIKDLAQFLLAVQFQQGRDSLDDILEPAKRNIKRQRSGRDKLKEVAEQRAASPTVPQAGDIGPTLMERELAGENVYGPQRAQPAPLGNSMGDYVPYREGVNAAPIPYPDEGGFKQEEIWRKFQEMNQNLDYDAVAAQAIEKGGGNGISVPGGTFSQMPENNFAPDHPQSDEAYMQWVKDFTYDQEVARKLDPRSRAYDPQGAELLMGERAQRDSNAAQMIYSKAQEQRAQAEADNVELVRRQMMLQSSPRGQVGTLIGALMESTDPEIDGATRQALREAMVLNALGKTEEAMEILRQLEQAGTAAAAASNKTGDPQVIG
jgi:hypothetical protein